MKLNIENKIRKYNFEEVILILQILSSNLSVYSEDDLISFTEDIEGRIDVLFDSNFLQSLSEYLKPNKETLRNFSDIKLIVLNLYSNQWHHKLKENSLELNTIRVIANKILDDLKVERIEPKIYRESHLNVNW